MTMTTAEQLLKKEAQEQARLDAAVESWEQSALERIDQLLNEPDDRDPEIFEMLGVDPEVTFDDYAAIPVEDRDPTWTTGLAALFAAVKLQVFAERQSEFVGIIERRFNRLYKDLPDEGELKKAATTGISRAEIKAARATMDEWRQDS
jgi:lysine/ornithine N-monooxygenase